MRVSTSLLLGGLIGLYVALLLFSLDSVSPLAYPALPYAPLPLGLLAGALGRRRQPAGPWLWLLLVNGLLLALVQRLALNP